MLLPGFLYGSVPDTEPFRRMAISGFFLLYCAKERMTDDETGHHKGHST